MSACGCDTPAALVRFVLVCSCVCVCVCVSTVCVCGCLCVCVCGGVGVVCVCVCVCVCECRDSWIAEGFLFCKIAYRSSDNDIIEFACAGNSPWTCLQVFCRATSRRKQTCPATSQISAFFLSSCLLYLICVQYVLVVCGFDGAHLRCLSLFHPAETRSCRDTRSATNYSSRRRWLVDEWKESSTSE